MAYNNNKVEKEIGSYAGTKIPPVLKKGLEDAIHRHLPKLFALYPRRDQGKAFTRTSIAADLFCE